MRCDDMEEDVLLHLNLQQLLDRRCSFHPSTSDHIDDHHRHNPAAAPPQEIMSSTVYFPCAAPSLLPSFPPYDDDDDDGYGGDLCPRTSTTGYRNSELLANSGQLHGTTLGQEPNDPCMLKERIARALRLYKESADEDALVQVWAPAKNGDRYVLTTSGQPFVLVSHTTTYKLLQYRTISLMYFFPVGGDFGRDLGLPGRVFKRRRPEWTPNVQYYGSDEYSRLNYALIYGVQGTLALPILEPTSHSCHGVVELVMTSPKLSYAHEVDKLCKALEAVTLKSCEIFCHPSIEMLCNDEARRLALSEILEILSVVCEAQKLPLAQAWIQCKHCNSATQCVALETNCSHYSPKQTREQLVCMSTSGAEFYITDARVWGFREACVEHHLQRGQGIVGKAIATRSSCFCTDVTKYSKNEYPLVHYARMFGLVGCLAVCLPSNVPTNEEYVLEFFLPLDCKSIPEQKAAVDTISTMMRECFCNLKAIATSNSQDLFLESIANDNCEHKIPVGGHYASYRTQDQHLVMDATTGICSKIHLNQHGSGDPDSVLVSEKKIRSAPDRRRGKAEKSVSLEVLQQYFSGSLKDAAKSLGVCPTTMKRICRQHGISRWPSRKISKVNRSLCKLKHVIESVECLNSIANSRPLPADIHRDKVDRLPLEKDERHDPLASSVQEQGGLKLEQGGGASGLSTLKVSSSQGSCQEHAPDQVDETTSTTMQDDCARVVAIKARYKEDIIRFRLSWSAGVMALKEQLAKRLKLEIGIFDIKYLDDDHEWVLLSCDADFEECLQISSSSRAHVIRLLVQDIVASFGSSCESSDD